MDGGDLGVRLRCQKPEQVGGDLAFLDLPDRRPARPDPGEEGERSVLVEGEPDRLAGATRRQLVLRKAGERNEAPALRVQPALPVRRGGVADVSDAPIDPSTLEREHRRWHAPARKNQLSAVLALPDDRGAVVGEYTGQRRHVAGPVMHGTRQLSDRGLAFRDAVEVAHARMIAQ